MFADTTFELHTPEAPAPPAPAWPPPRPRHLAQPAPARGSRFWLAWRVRGHFTRPAPVAPARPPPEAPEMRGRRAKPHRAFGSPGDGRCSKRRRGFRGNRRRSLAKARADSARRRRRRARDARATGARGSRAAASARNRRSRIWLAWRRARARNADEVFAEIAALLLRRRSAGSARTRRRAPRRPRDRRPMDSRAAAPRTGRTASRIWLAWRRARSKRGRGLAEIARLLHRRRWIVHPTSCPGPRIRPAG